MRSFGFFFMLLLSGTTAFLYLGFSSKGTTVFNPGMVSIGNMNGKSFAMERRKLIKRQRKMDEDEDDGGVEDYRPIDPIPSSTANSIRHGPIQHGAPLMPYIPKPSPPPTQDQKHGE